MDVTPSFLRFWGKAHPDAEVPSHPVAYHLLDVAAVVRALLDARPLALARASRVLGLTQDEARRLLTALSALHDLGKFTPAFQAKAIDCWPASVLGTCDPSTIINGRHTDDGYVLWTDRLAGDVVQRLWPAAGEALGVLAPAIFGHHGRPVGGRRHPPTVEQRFQRRETLAAALACADAVLGLLAPDPIPSSAPSVDAARRASWWVSGLITVADWVGSSRTWFPYATPMIDDPDLAGYWRESQRRARQAVRATGLLPPLAAPRRSFAALTGIEFPPSPAQSWAESMPLPNGALLVILEDLTGAGKTEAAHLLVHRLMAAGRASGAYWAMPTQATANAMYSRQADLLDALFADPERRPSLVLAHGQQRLYERFRASVLDGASDETCARNTDPSVELDDDELSATATCSAWLADDRRAAMIADVGAGTIDQALLAVLPSKFNTVRLLGLSDKILVVDEAHAYDRYMGVELEELLRFHAALGGCTVVLSATLPKSRREQLVGAWRDGLRGGQRRLGESAFVQATAYPLATVVSGDGVQEVPLEAAPWSCRRIPMRFVHDLDSALSHVVAAARAGASVVWVRNTVDDCLAAAALLRKQGVDPLVFHARFAQADRQRREQEVLHRFGPGATDEARRGRVVVATQVVEQSLDLDFDAMVSDLAPVDLLVQRVGRLQRHPAREASRPIGLALELVILSPPPTENPEPGWLGGIFAGTSHVYEDPGILWRTVRTLAGARAIELPGNLRELIESVYGTEEVPDALLAGANRAAGQSSAHAATATYATLKVGDGYDASVQAWVSDLRVPTRIDARQTVVRLARVKHDGPLTPWSDEEPPWKGWALSEVRLSAARVPAGVEPESRFAAQVVAARKTWGRFDQDIPLLPLEQMGDGEYRGVLRHPSRRDLITVRYTANEGLHYDDRG